MRGKVGRTPLRYDGLGLRSREVSTWPLSIPTARPVFRSPFGWPVKPVNRTVDMVLQRVEATEAAHVVFLFHSSKKSE